MPSPCSQERSMCQWDVIIRVLLSIQGNAIVLQQYNSRLIISDSVNVSTGTCSSLLDIITWDITLSRAGISGDGSRKRRNASGPEQTRGIAEEFISLARWGSFHPATIVIFVVRAGVTGVTQWRTRTERGACALRGRVGGGSVWRETAQKPVDSPSRACAPPRAGPSFGCSQTPVSQEESPGGNLRADPLCRLPFSSYCPEADSGKSFSSSFSGCTSDTLFILVKI